MSVELWECSMNLLIFMNGFNIYPEESLCVDTDYMQGESSPPQKQADAELLYIC